jgi:fused signal recognition particle receptor
MFGFLKSGLAKTVDAIKKIIPKTEEYLTKEQIEEILIESDVEYDVVESIISYLPTDKVNRVALYNSLISLFIIPKEFEDVEKPFVELIIGVNGAGKTTTIAKLANKYKQDGRSVVLGAGDTFRAAAIEQLTLWANKIDVPIIFTKQGADPSGVAYDTINSAISKKIDRVIIDTAGRLHTQSNLANELKKIVRVCDKAMVGSPHRKILILDGTQGNSAIAQAKAFDEMVDIDGIIITKLDGTAKGGAVFSIVSKLKLPIFYIGVGEKADDLIKFDADSFVNTILDAIYK